MHVGKKIRDLRLRRGLTVQQLATASGLSKGFISQVENDHTSPSLTTLSDIAKALEVSVAYLVVDEDPTPFVVRASERRRIRVGGRVGFVEVLSASPKRNVEMILVEIPAGPGEDGKRHYHHGEECVFVLDGRVKVSCGDQEFTLESGDSIHYDGRIPHAMQNVGEQKARVVTAMSPASFEPLLRVAGTESASTPRTPRAGR